MFAGTGSSVGKTTVVCGVIATLKRFDKKVISFKCGPDYIDPMFHQKVTEVVTRNLDGFLMGEDNLINTLIAGEEACDIAVVEGAMGIFDGMGKSTKYSANSISVITSTPTILIVNPNGQGISVCAQIKGFLEFEQNNICGVLLNNIKVGMYKYYKEMIEEQLGIEVVGFIPHLEEVKISSRHLGLVTADEIDDIKSKIEIIGDNVLKYCDMERIIEVANSSKYLKENNVNTIDKVANVNLYVARDKAFCFIYDDNIEILQQMGANIHYFSPIDDQCLPDDVDGLLFFGGYPELYGTLLENNKSMQNSIREKISKNVPVYAECGGFMYLQNTITDLEGIKYQMLGIIDSDALMTKSLQNFGYTKITNKTKNNFLNGSVNAHSFHHSVSTSEGESFKALKVSNNMEYDAVYTSESIFASYMHIHFINNLELPRNFIKLCEKGVVNNEVNIKT